MQIWIFYFLVPLSEAATWKGQLNIKFQPDSTVFASNTEGSPSTSDYGCASLSRDRDQIHCLHQSKCFLSDFNRNFRSQVSDPVRCFMRDNILVPDEGNRKKITLRYNISKLILIS